MPVEIIRLIAASADEPEENAALSLCNKDLEIILSAGFTSPEVTAYVAVCSLERTLILRTIRIHGGNSMVNGLTRNVTNDRSNPRYLYAPDDLCALDILADSNRTDLFMVLQPFLTPGDSSILAAFKGAVAYKNQQLINILLPLLHDMAEEAFAHTCLFSTGTISAAVLAQIPVDRRADACSAAFELAITSGNVAIVEMLTAGGADINMVFTNEEDEMDERTALHWLGTYGLWQNEHRGSILPMVRMLITAGADVNRVDYQGRTILHELAMNGSRAVTPRLEFEDDITDQRPDSVYRRVLTMLLIGNADIDAQDDTGATPLHLAVSRGETVMIQMLLQNRVNAVITNDDGLRASNMNGDRTAPATIDLDVYKYEVEQVERFGPKWVEVL